MTENKQIQEMAKCCTYYHNGECCADATDISKCDLMCEMFGVFTNLQKENYRKVERGKWISVEDRLPDNNGRVLVYLGNNHHVKTDTDRYFGYWARWGENVTHWMPLPEPPSGADMRGE